MQAAHQPGVLGRRLRGMRVQGFAPALDPGMDKFDRLRARHFPLGIAAHAVRDDVQTQLVVEQHAVLVVRSAAADIRLAR